MGRIIVLFLLAAPVWAQQDWQTELTTTLLQQWQQLGGDVSNAEISLTSVSEDYQLPDCPVTPEISLSKPIQPGRNGVELICPSPWWQQFVAVQLHVMQDVAILTHAVNSGDPARPSGVIFSQQDLGELSQGYILQPSQLANMEYRRNLRAGTVLTPDMLRPAEVISRGQQVRVTVQRGAIKIESKAEALSDGRMGKTIRVRNLRSGKVVSGLVVGPGEVLIR